MGAEGIGWSAIKNPFLYLIFIHSQTKYIIADFKNLFNSKKCHLDGSNKSAKKIVNFLLHELILALLPRPLPEQIYLVALNAQLYF